MKMHDEDYTSGSFECASGLYTCGCVMENNVKYAIPLVNEHTLTTISGGDIDCAKACRKKILKNEDGDRVGCTHWSVTKEPANGEKKCYLAFPSFSEKPHEDFVSGSVDCAEEMENVTPDTGDQAKFQDYYNNEDQIMFVDVDLKPVMGACTEGMEF